LLDCLPLRAYSTVGLLYVIRSGSKLQTKPHNKLRYFTVLLHLTRQCLPCG